MASQDLALPALLGLLSKELSWVFSRMSPGGPALYLSARYSNRVEMERDSSGKERQVFYLKHVVVKTTDFAYGVSDLEFGSSVYLLCDLEHVT